MYSRTSNQTPDVPQKVLSSISTSNERRGREEDISLSKGKSGFANNPFLLHYAPKSQITEGHIGTKLRALLITPSY